MWIKHLNDTTDTPRKPNIAQFIMGLPEYKGLVDKLFEEHVQQERLSTGNKQISLRNKVAKEIFEGLSEEQKANLRNWNDDEHEKTLTALGLENEAEEVPALSSEEQQR